LDMYKSAPKEQRDKVQLMAAEKKSKAEVRAEPGCGRGLRGSQLPNGGPHGEGWVGWVVTLRGQRVRDQIATFSG